MKLVYLGTISTGLVVSLGIAIIAPAFFLSSEQEDNSVKILTQFEITPSENLPEWCEELKIKLEENSLKSVVFISGEIAEEYPECIFNLDYVDFGSQGYAYQKIPDILDYSIQLSEVKNGKKTIDDLGNFDSQLFKAPYGSIDQNIYSLLSRSGIKADFSYEDQYNLYIDGQFLRFDLITLSDPDVLNKIDSSQVVAFSFNSSDEIAKYFSNYF